MVIRKLKIDNYNDARKIIATTKCDEYVYDRLAKKILQSSFLIENIDNRAANVLKQDALSCGCDVAVSKDISLFKKGFSTVILCANRYQTEKLALKINSQPFGLKEISKKILELLEEEKERKIVCANRKIILRDTPLVMGIINLSEDSFFGNGFADRSQAIEAALDMQRQGADIIDIGAESTRPGSKPVDIKDEIAKIKSFLNSARKKIKVPISIDTYKPEVAEVALGEGADIINDIYALRYPVEDKKIGRLEDLQRQTANNGNGRKKTKKNMAKIIAKNKAAVVLMHTVKTPLTMQQNIKYNNLISDIFCFLEKQSEYALENGIKKESIMIDPGIGFGKTVNNNLEILKRLFEFKSLDYPLLVGLSNKSFLAKVIKNENREERFSANIAANVIAAVNGADILRVHNVKEIKQALLTVNAVEKV